MTMEEVFLLMLDGIHFTEVKRPYAVTTLL